MAEPQISSIIVELVPDGPVPFGMPDPGDLAAFGAERPGRGAGPGAPLLLSCSEGQTLVQAVYLSGYFQPPPLCSGLSLCRRCRLRFLSAPPEPVADDLRAFSLTELMVGFRLGCRHQARPGMRFSLPPEVGFFYASLTAQRERVAVRQRRDAATPSAATRSAVDRLSFDRDTFNRLTGRVRKSGTGGYVSGSSTIGSRENTGPGLIGLSAAGTGATEASAQGPGVLLAVDLGTTSLQWLAVARDTGAVIWRGGMVNPQMGAGSDVISRVGAAATARGRSRLHKLTLQALRGIVENTRFLASGASLSGMGGGPFAAASAARAGGAGKSPGAGGLPGSADVAAVCLAANPAMTGLALNRDVSGLARAPYSLPLQGGDWAFLPDFPQIWTPPQLAPFVGGDISAGYAALALDPLAPPPVYPFLLADMGTNGEFLLALSPDEALCASVALGPALEGIGLSRGVEARPFAVVAFELSPKGLEPRFLPESATEAGASGSGPALALAAENTERIGLGGLPVHLRDSPEALRELPGITGTGYLSLLHILLTHGIMDRDGHFRAAGDENPGTSAKDAPVSGNAPAGAEAGPLGRFFPFSDNGDLLLPAAMRLTPADVEEVLKVKAAFSLGLSRLLLAARLRSADLAGIYLAGSLGRHVDKNALESLGFFPNGTIRRISAPGNTSLAGAALLLREPRLRGRLAHWAARVRCVDLARDPAFAAAFPEHMRFSW